MGVLIRLLVLLVACGVGIYCQDWREVSRVFSQGRSFSAEEARDAELALQKKPGDLQKRAGLIAYYTFNRDLPEPEAVAGRKKHLAWFARERPDGELWSSYPYAMRIYSSGDRLADQAGLMELAAIWRNHISKRKSNTREFTKNAANFLQLVDGPLAMEILSQSGLSSALPQVIANLLLGVTAQDFDSGDAIDMDPKVRAVAASSGIPEMLTVFNDPQLLGRAALYLARQGSSLGEKGFRDGDYFSLPRTLWKRARELEPDNVEWTLFDPELPQEGIANRFVYLRFTPKLAADRLVSSVQPTVPSELRSVKGTVELSFAIGEDGSVMRVFPRSGPRELHAISVEAVKQWKYRPVLLNGKPVIAVSTVALQY